MGRKHGHAACNAQWAYCANRRPGLQPGWHTNSVRLWQSDRGRTGEVKIWDAETGQELLTLQGAGYTHVVAFRSDGNWLASLSRGKLKIYDATPLLEKP